ncbi:1-phosphatidylinositol-4-phosphate 5-kinase, partial [Geosmithia morbida]
GPPFRRHNRSDSINEPYDDASYSSTSDSSELVSPMTANGTDTDTALTATSTATTTIGSMASSANRSKANGRFEHDAAPVNRNAGRYDANAAMPPPSTAPPSLPPIPNGRLSSSFTTTILPDRTAATRHHHHTPPSATVNGNMSGIDAAATSDKTLPQLPHHDAQSIDQQPDRAFGRSGEHPHPSKPSRAAPVPSHTPPPPPPPPPPPLPQSQSQSHLPPADALSSADTTPTKHRLSSPPAYQTNGTSSTSLHLFPPPPGSTLKQRHTLEVPKLSSAARHSRDGADSVGGRYSPSPQTVSSATASATATGAATAVGGGAAAGNRRPSLSLARRTTRSMQSDNRDEVAPDEDAARWAEAYRQKRASKRKRREEEGDEDRVVVGTKVDESHANWVTAYNMLTGIRVSVSRTNAKLDRELTDADFQAKQKSTFDIAGNELVPSAKYDFKFKDYAPWVFRHLRSLFRLDPADYLMSLTGKYILSELGSPGKSGSFFYFSRDYKYIIKTIHHAEHKFLRKILKEYYVHVKDNPNTLLSQFYGLHRVKLPYGKKIHFVVMNNLFPPHRDIHTTFDLKGSTVGRDYREEDLENNPRATLKDLNWLRRKRNLELGLYKKHLFLSQLQRDVGLLKRLQIMDYSLLVGIHDVSRGNEENLRDKTLQVFNPGGDKSNTDDEGAGPSVLLRTPSKLENARKARELRQMIRSEKPVPIGEALDKMPNELAEGQGRPGFVFNQDDGGFRATHEDNGPADEIYYLGVIDCLTHYGMIKKIEHFWKGLTSDRSQISALPPDQYGDRFYQFIEGVTMSSEEAHREAQRLDEEMAAEAERELEEQREQREQRQRSSRDGPPPPVPDHLPPAPPGTHDSTMARASRAAVRSEENGASEKHVPERTLRTIAPPHSSSSGEKRDSAMLEPVLPVVEEAGENGNGNGGDASRLTPRNSRDKNLYGPTTPSRMQAPTRAPPPTPPKTATGTGADSEKEKAESVDSGYHASGQPRLSRESVRNKTLPPLPPGDPRRHNQQQQQQHEEQQQREHGRFGMTA